MLHDPVETCDTWLLRKSTVRPKTEPSGTWTIRQASSYVAGIRWHHLNTLGRSSAPIISHNEPSAHRLANCASENFGSPPCALTATEHLRMLTGLFGVHRVLRGPPEHLRAFAGNQRHLSPSGLTRAFRGSSHDLPGVANFGSLPCGMTATECPRTLTGASGLYRIS